MAGMKDIMTLGGVVLVAGGLYYAYTKGYLDDIVGQLGLGGGGGGTTPAEGEEYAEGGGTTTTPAADCKFVSRPMDSDPKRFRIDDDKGKEAGGGKYYNSKAEADAVIATMCKSAAPKAPTSAPKKGEEEEEEEEYKEPAKAKDEVDAIVEATKPKASDDCKKKFGGSCTQECKSKSSKKCKDCEKACGKKSNLALAYAGSYYDGQVLDTAYFVTTPSSFIPRRHENTIAMGVSIA